MAACTGHWKHGWNRVSCIEQTWIISSWNYSRPALSSAELQLMKPLLRAVKWTNQQPSMAIATNNAGTVLRCLMHTWTDIDGAQHLVFTWLQLTPRSHSKHARFSRPFPFINVCRALTSLSLHKQPFGFAACEVFLLCLSKVDSYSFTRVLKQTRLSVNNRGLRFRSD